MIRIEHEVPGVVVVLHRTIAEAIQDGLGKDMLQEPPIRHLRNRLLPAPKGPVEDDQTLAEVLLVPLIGPFDDGQPYIRTLALASIDSEMCSRDFSRELGGRGYFPAGVNESMSYFALSRSPRVEAVLHMGTLIRDRKLQESRLITYTTDGAELLPFFPGKTKLKPSYHVVVVREEGKQAH